MITTVYDIWLFTSHYYLLSGFFLEVQVEKMGQAIEIVKFKQSNESVVLNSIKES